MKFFNKRGQSMLVYMFYILIGLTLSFFFILGVHFMIKSTTEDSTFHKRFYSRDLALLVDALHASNGAFVIGYEINPPQNFQLDVNLTPDKVILTDRSDIPFERRAKSFFPFGYNEFVNITPSGIGMTPVKFKVLIDNKSIKLDSPEEVPFAFCIRVDDCSDYCKVVSPKNKGCDDYESDYCEDDPCQVGLMPGRNCVLEFNKGRIECKHHGPKWYG